MAIDDNTIYGLYGSQIKDLPEKINAVKGLARELTSADYNWPTASPDGVALWLLEPGIYTVYSGTKWYSTSATSYDTNTGLAIIRPEKSGLVPMLYARNGGDWLCQQITKSTGVRSGSLDTLMSTAFVVDNLTSTSTTSPLSANQGKVLKDLIDGLAISGAGAPTTSTVGTVGKLYEDTTNGKLYICTDTTGGTYTWVEVGAGGGGPTVVQTTGTSTTDVMSQNAVTSMVFADPSTKQKVQIGEGARTTGTYSVAIGKSAEAAKDIAVALGSNTHANGDNAIAIGQFSAALAKGSIAIGRSAEARIQGTVVFNMADNFGYNNTQYMLITGLYDPQSDHDAATKGYVDNSLLGKQDALTAGSGISITDESGSLVISATGGGGGGLDPNTTFWGQTASNGAVTGRITFGTNGYVNGTNSTVTVYADTAGGADPFEFSHTGLDVASKKITNLAAPTANGDAANKNYVDTATSGKADITYVNAQLDGKQDELTAGTGITITDESGALVISATAAEPDTFTTNEWNALWA